MRLLIDTAGTGIQNWKLDRHYPSQPHLTRLALFSDDPSFGGPICSLTMAPVSIDEEARAFYGISDEDLAVAGENVEDILFRFLRLLVDADSVAGYSVNSHKRLLDRTTRDLDLPDRVDHPRSGGAMLTLSALSTATGTDLAAAAETELARVWSKIDTIRAKQAAKPKDSPLPE